MIPRLAKAIQGIVSASGVSESDSTPATVALGIDPLQISDPERPEDQCANADIESDRQRLRSRLRPPFDSPTILGNEFRFMNISSPTEPRRQVGHETQDVPRSHLVSVMVPREDLHSAKGKISTNAAEPNTFFFTDVEEYHSGGIVLPATQPPNGSTGGRESGGTTHSSLIPNDGSTQLKRQVSNVVEERDKIVLELFKQKANFERTIADLEKQRDEQSRENEALKITLNELHSGLEASETSAQHLLSEHKRLDDQLSHAHNISAQRQFESETLQSTVVTLKEENKAMISGHNATIKELKAKCNELDKKIVSLNTAHLEDTRRADKNNEESKGLSAKLAETESLVKKLESEKTELEKTLERANEEHKGTKIEHEKEMDASKARHHDVVDDYKKRMEAMEKKNADLEEEMQKVKASLRDRKTHAEERLTESEETAVESEAVETPDKSKAYAGLGKRRIVESVDNTEPHEKKSRRGLSDHGIESTRGRTGFRHNIGRLLGRSHSRARGSEIDERKTVKETPKKAPVTPPGSIAKSDSLSSTGTSNNADDEASVVGDDGVESSPAGVSGTPKISVSKADDENEYVFVDSASSVADSTKGAKLYESRWPPLNARSLSREPLERLKLPEPVSPTPRSPTHQRSRSPFSPLRGDRPPKVHAATSPYPSHRAQSPPPSAPRRVTSPIYQGTYASPSRKRKQEAELNSQPVIESWYKADGGVDSMGRQTKRNRTGT